MSLSISSIAQSTVTVRDFETWSALALNYKLNKKVTLGLEEQLRLKDNSSVIDQYFTEVTGKYKLINGLSPGLGLRYIRENDNVGKVQGYENHLRWNFDLGYKHSIKKIALKYRLRYQSKSELGVDAAELDNTVRLKIGLGYNIKDWKLDPWVSGEIFNTVGSESDLKKYRLTLKTEYKTKNIGSFGAFYRLEQQLNKANPKTTNIAGFKYTYALERK